MPEIAANAQIVSANHSRKKPQSRKKRAKLPLPKKIEATAIYTRPQAAQVVGCDPITIQRAYYSGHLDAYRIGRHIKHSGQHLIDWLEAGGKTR